MEQVTSSTSSAENISLPQDSTLPVPEKKSKGSKMWVIGLLIVAAVGLGYLVYNAVAPIEDTDNSENNSDKVTQDTKNSQSWKKVGLVIEGAYADSEVVDLGNGTFRQYYGVEPEVVNGNFKVYSATSTDGVTWTQEEGVRSEGSTTFLAPDINKLPDGSYRMYYGSREGGIKSAVSKDALNWTVEEGNRIGKTSKYVPEIEMLGFPSSYTDATGKVTLVYRGSINTKYGVQTPNNKTTLLLWATSKDGLTFEEQGVAIDSRNSVLEGHVDGPEFAVWDDNSIRLYYWGYRGIYYSTFDGATFSEPVFAYTSTSSNDPLIRYQPDPPSDPTLAKINGVWHMYYGNHTKGIVLAKYAQ